MTTCGEFIVRLLESYGVDTIFGIPGVHTVELYRGLADSPIRHVTPRHEQGAGFMADGYARVTGKPGACFIITGPGMTNILTAMGQAYADSIPMLVISSVNQTDQLAMGDGRLHELPSQRNMTAGVAAFSHTVLTPAQLPQVMARAFAVFNSARPRPVHIEIPIDVISMPIDAALSAKAWPLPSRPAPAAVAIKQAADWLAAAKSPAIVLGGGAVEGAAEALALAEHLDAPVVHTVNAKGILPPGHKLRAGENMALPPIRKLLESADVVLAVGTEFGETEMYPDARPLQLQGKLIRIDLDPEQLMRGLPADCPITADAKLALSDLNRQLASHKHTDRNGAARAAETFKAAATHWWPAVGVHQRIADVILKTLPDVIMVGDSTEPVYALNQSYQAPTPRAYFNSSTGYGTLGYGLPAGIGAKLAAPKRPVVVLAGDGGLQFTIGELAAAVEAEVPVIVFLWNNHGYGEIKTYMQNRQIKPIGVDIFTPDFQVIAKGFGCAAVHVENLDQLPQQLTEATKRKVPTIIEMRPQA
ncbi:MAG: 5-guanidino-2-oxopentanoate decarboxylase [Rhodospirillaceae bacterium]|nr:MAG: 5-guanidino-2-oxopentanoate decarboxylase [Rhodospirillaceae bacterium]